MCTHNGQLEPEICCDLCNPELLDKTRPGDPTKSTRTTRLRRGVKSDWLVKELCKWRTGIKKSDYPHSLFGASGILSDSLIDRLASVGPIKTKEKMKKILGMGWSFQGKYEDKLWAYLTTLDMPPFQLLPKKSTSKAGAKRPAEAEATEVSVETATDAGGRPSKRARTKAAVGCKQSGAKAVASERTTHGGNATHGVNATSLDGNATRVYDTHVSSSSMHPLSSVSSPCPGTLTVADTLFTTNYQRVNCRTDYMYSSPPTSAVQPQPNTPTLPVYSQPSGPSPGADALMHQDYSSQYGSWACYPSMGTQAWMAPVLPFEHHRVLPHPTPASAQYSQYTQPYYTSHLPYRHAGTALPIALSSQSRTAPSVHPNSHSFLPNS